MTDLTTPRVGERPDVPRPRRGDAQPAGYRAPVAPGVALDRLLALARPTAAQALELAGGVLAIAAELPAGSAGADPVLVDPVVTVDGRVRPAVVRDEVSSGGRPVAAVLADVVAAARLPGADSGVAAEPHLAQLDRAVADLEGTSLAVLARRLQEAVAEPDRSAARAGLSALVRAIGEAAGGAGATGGRTAGRRGAGEAAGEAAGGARAEPVQAVRRRTGSAGRRIGAWLLSIVVLGTVVAAEVVLLGDDITRDIDLLLDAGRDEEQPGDAPEPEGPPLVAPAPATAGNVAGVDLRPLALCAPGTPCTVRLLVRLIPAPEPQVVSWSYQVVDRCTGATGSAPGGTVTVPPHADRATAVGVVPLPPAAAVAVFAVTGAPAVAASAPVSAGSCAPTAATG